VNFMARPFLQKIIFVPLLVLLAGLFFVARAAGGQLQAQARQETVYENFLDIPGVTPEEAEAIEKLRENRSSFVFGMEPSAECFIRQDGSAGASAPCSAIC
jgi:hypothetical protein